MKTSGWQRRVESARKFVAVLLPLAVITVERFERDGESEHGSAFAKAGEAFYGAAYRLDLDARGHRGDHRAALVQRGC